jgi:hypothetical protein
MTSGFGDPDLGAEFDDVSSETSSPGVELETELCLERREASSAISSAGRRIGVFGVDSVSRNFTNASARLTSSFSESEFRAGIMFRRYRRPYPGPSSPVLNRSSSLNPRTLAISPNTSVFCLASAWSQKKNVILYSRFDSNAENIEIFLHRCINRKQQYSSLLIQRVAWIQTTKLLIDKIFDRLFCNRFA